MERIFKSVLSSTVNILVFRCLFPMHSLILGVLSQTFYTGGILNDYKIRRKPVSRRNRNFN